MWCIEQRDCGRRHHRSNIGAGPDHALQPRRKQIGIDRLFETEKYGEYNRETVDMMLNEAEKLAVEVLLPTYDKGDREGCTFDKGKVKAPP